MTVTEHSDTDHDAPADEAYWAALTAEADALNAASHRTVAVVKPPTGDVRIPHDDDLERAVIGTALTWPEHAANLLVLLPVDDLYRPTHRTMWQAIAALVGTDTLPDARLLAARLAGNPDAERAIAEASVSAVSPAIAAGYVTTITDLAHRRRGLVAIEEAKAALLDPGRPLLTTLDPLGRLIEDAARAGNPGGYAESLIDWPDLWADDDDTADWLLEPIVPRGRSVALYSHAKSGKSLTILDACAAAVTGRPVYGQPADDPIRVLYVDQEMTRDDVRERLTDLGYGPADDLSGLAYYLLPDLPPLDTLAGGETLLQLATEHAADLVVIDTLSRVLSGGENDADTIRAFYRHTGSRLKAAGIAVLRLDHAGKDVDKGQRGSSAKADDVDIVWRLASTDDGVKLTATHRRIGWVPEVVALERSTHPLVHRVAEASKPTGTVECAVALDQLGVPLNATRREAAAALKAAGESRRNAVIGAALRHRRERA